MSTARTLILALRIAKAHDDLDNAHKGRDLYVQAGCHDLSGWDRRITIREARIAMMIYALNYRA